MDDALWTPSQTRMQRSSMTAFLKWLHDHTGLDFPDYWSLHKWSIDHLEDFWRLFLEFTGIIYSAPYTDVLDTQRMPGARWFRGMQLNFAENILQPQLDGTAIVSVIEGRETHEELRFDELRALVARCAHALKESGIGTGHRVVGCMSDVPEAIIASLACACLGATWCSTSPDFGIEAICDRFGQVEPRLAFVTTHYLYNTKTFRTDDRVAQLHDLLPSLEKVVSVPYPVGEPNIVGDISWNDFLGSDDITDIEYTQVPFDHPLYILFTSGTTGPPKCLVHGTGGVLLQLHKEMRLHCDIRKGDLLSFYTTCAWVMWNWRLVALSLGTRTLLYDGHPCYPDIGALWRIADDLGVTHFGTSGRFLESCMKHQPPIAPGTMGHMNDLRTILYTGSPLSENGFRWVYSHIKENLQLSGISGGTDIASSFMVGNPNLPVHAGELQCPALGTDITALDEEGNELREEPGELVCRKPLPSMPVSFWNDPEGALYRKAYFDAYPGMWRQGDYVEFTPHGGIIIYGRSDATLKPGGVRIGTAGIYSSLEQLDFVQAAVAVGWKPPDEADERVILFVVLQEDESLDDDKKQKIKQHLRTTRSPRHVPYRTFQISALPVTRSGKTVELSVKNVLAGRDVRNINAIANPEVLEECKKTRTALLDEHGGA